MRRAIVILSFFLVHFAIAAVVFLFGAVFGASQIQIMSATGGTGGRAHGFGGGANAVEHLLILYVFSIGIVPLAISLVSSAIAWAVTRNLATQRSERKDEEGQFQGETPRLSIAHLLLWTMCCAIGFGVARIRVGFMSLMQDGHYQNYASIFIVVTGLTLGTSATALLLWGYWRYRKISFPRFEGEVFLCALAISTLFGSLFMSIMRLVLSGSGWLVPLGSLPAALVVWGSIAFVRSPRWTTLLIIFGLYVMAGGFMFLVPVVLGALIVIAILDWRQAKSYPWTHWAGIGMGFFVIVAHSAFKVYALFVLR